MKRAEKNLPDTEDCAGREVQRSRGLLEVFATVRALGQGRFRLFCTALSAEIAGVACMAVFAGPGAVVSSGCFRSGHGGGRGVELQDGVFAVSVIDQDGGAVIAHVHGAAVGVGHQGLAVYVNDAGLSVRIFTDEGCIAMGGTIDRDFCEMLLELAGAGRQDNDGAVEVLDGGKGAAMALEYTNGQVTLPWASTKPNFPSLTTPAKPLYIRLSS